MNNEITINRKVLFWKGKNIPFHKDFKLPDFGTKTIQFKDLPQKFKKPINIFECIGQFEFIPSVVRNNIRRANEQTLSLSQKELNERLNLDWITNRHSLNLKEASILFSAEKFFNLPPLLFLSPTMQTPIEYACDKLSISIPRKNVSPEHFKKKINTCSKRALGNTKKLAEELQIPPSKLYHQLSNIKLDIFIPTIANVFYPSYLWCWLYAENDYALIEEINNFYLDELKY